MELVRRPKTFAALILALAVGFAAAFAGSTAFGGEEPDLPKVSSDAVVRIAQVPASAGLPALAAKAQAAKPAKKKKARKARKKKAAPKVRKASRPAPRTYTPPVATARPYVPPSQPRTTAPKPQTKPKAPVVDEFEEF